MFPLLVLAMVVSKDLLPSEPGVIRPCPVRWENLEGTLSLTALLDGGKASSRVYLPFTEDMALTASALKQRSSTLKKHAQHRLGWSPGPSSEATVIKFASEAPTVTRTLSGLAPCQLAQSARSASVPPTWAPHMQLIRSSHARI